MDDKDVVRLEDRIEALGRESQLRLELAMSRIDAKFETILHGLATLQTDLTGQRAALTEQGASLRAALDEHRVANRAALDDLRGSMRGLYGLVVGAWITIIVAVVRSALGATALWGDGFQAGQAERALVAPQNTK